jgi:glycosyltransferase involved in cell wall biosynthesis
VTDGPKISVLVPAFNEAPSLGELCERIAAVMHRMGVEHFEILIVDDGSTDGSHELIRRLAADTGYVRGIFLQTNFGKATALMVGFRNARGRYIVTMDADLQDDPDDIPRLFAALEQGYDLVSGWRQRRQDQPLRKVGSRLYNAVVRLVTGLDIHDMNCGFKIYRAEVVRRLFVYGHYHRYIPLLSFQIGFRVGETPVANNPRKHGLSRYRTLRWQGLFDLLSILFVYRYSLSPLHFFGLLSLLLLLPSTLTIAWLVGQHLAFLLGLTSTGQLLERPILSISLTLFVTGVLVFLVGFVCEFMLHHHIRANIDRIVAFSVGGSTDEPQPERAERRRHQSWAG